MQGIVLAGVHAWGESLLEQICCRPLLPVLGRPLVWYVLDWLGRNGITRASICANSDTGIFKQCLGTTTVADVAVSYYADLMPRGPAGCVRDAAAASYADTFVIVDGTIVTRLDLDELLAAHIQAQAAVTVVVQEDPATAAVEPTGIYVVSRAALEHVPAKGYQDIKEMLIPRLYESGQRVMPYVARDRSLRVTSAASYLSIVDWALQDPPCLPGRYNHLDQALVHATSYIARGARLIGPVVVGPNCAIEDGVTVVGPTSIAPDTTIRRDAVVSRTAIWPRCRIGQGAIVDHSILTTASHVDDLLSVRDTVCMPRGSQHCPQATAELYWAMGASQIALDLLPADFLPVLAHSPRPPHMAMIGTQSRIA